MDVIIKISQRMAASFPQDTRKLLRPLEASLTRVLRTGGIRSEDGKSHIKIA
jgi:hypothetical protein